VSTTIVAPRHRLPPVARPKRSYAWHLPSWVSTHLPWIILGLSLAAFGYAVTTIRSAPASQFGLLASASPIYLLSILLAAGAFAVSVRRDDLTAAGAAVVAMIVCQRLPRVISTDVPMYAWTYKHLGVVDYIQQNHELARGVDVYNGWPGLFATTAWFSDLTSVPPISIAHWFTLLFHLAMAGLVYAAARAWQLSPAQSITASFLVVTLNWVEQDYFAPQATAMILTVALLILLSPGRHRTIVTLTLVLFAAVTITHQLTPYWIFLAVGLLVAGRKVKPWWMLIPMAAVLIGVLLYNFDITHQYAKLSLDVVGNATTNNPRQGAVGQLFTSTVMRALSLTMWGATAAVLFFRWRRKQPVWALGVLALSPILILGGQGYGGEAVFRVFLYSLPGCALVLAPVLLTALRATTTVRFAGALAALVLITAASAQAYFGSWATNLLSKAQVDAADNVLVQGDYPAYVTPLAPVWPERSSAKYVQYAKFTDTYDHSMMFQEELLGLHFDTDADYDKFMSLVGTRTDASTYVVLTEPMAMYGAYFGIFPFDAVTNLRERLKNDPRWQVVKDEQDVGVYLYRVPTP
jgi:hypothetical protein